MRPTFSLMRRKTKTKMRIYNKDAFSMGESLILKIKTIFKLRPNFSQNRIKVLMTFVDYESNTEYSKKIFKPKTPVLLFFFLSPSSANHPC